MVERRERKRVKRGKKEMIFLVGFSMEKIERRGNGGVEVWNDGERGVGI